MGQRVIFDEKALREEIIKQWGRAGAHIEVYDQLINELKALQDEVCALEDEVQCLVDEVDSLHCDLNDATEGRE